MKIRRANKNDLDDVLKLFSETILNSNKADYSDLQLAAWSSSIDDRERWLKKVEDQYFLLAEIDGKVTGFASINKGYLDTMFVHHKYQGKGIAKSLLEELESYAQQSGESQIITESSITACSFFSKHGFNVLKEQTVIRNGVEITNIRMVKDL